jgi:hypothetical protein
VGQLAGPANIRMTGAPSTKQVVRGRCPIDPKLHPLTHLPSFVGARPSSAAPVDQKPHPLTHICSSVGARPSPAAPVDQKPHPLTHVCSVEARPSPAAPVDQKPHPLTHVPSFVGAQSFSAAPLERTTSGPYILDILRLTALISHSIYYLSLKVELLTCL